MKAKSLLLAGAVTIASAVGAMAQGTVFSVNAVGFVNTIVPAGKQLIISNPLSAADNTVDAVLANVPDQTQLFKWNPTNQVFEANTYFTGFGWLTKTMSVVPGEAFYLRNAAPTNLTITFVGNVPQGSLTNSLVAGFNLVSSQVPQAGGLSGDLGMPTSNLDQVFTFDGISFTTYTYFEGFGWLKQGESTPTDPQIPVGTGCFVRKSAAVAWTRNFSVNN
jgi:hypothetical protein